MNAGSRLDIPEDVACAFCDYLAGRRPYTVLRRSDLAATFVTREQRGISHLLVLPVRHAPTILDLTDDEASAVMSEVRLGASLIDEVDRPRGISIWQNNGRPAAQSVAHMHFHVAGTLPGGGTEFGAVRELTVSETDLIAERLLGSSQN